MYLSTGFCAFFKKLQKSAVKNHHKTNRDFLIPEIKKLSKNFKFGIAFFKTIVYTFTKVFGIYGKVDGDEKNERNYYSCIGYTRRGS